MMSVHVPIHLIVVQFVTMAAFEIELELVPELVFEHVPEPGLQLVPVLQFELEAGPGLKLELELELDRLEQLE